jgi:hypothetical protein
VANQQADQFGQTQDLRAEASRRNLLADFAGRPDYASPSLRQPTVGGEGGLGLAAGSIGGFFSWLFNTEAFQNWNKERKLKKQDGGTPETTYTFPLDVQPQWGTDPASEGMDIWR